MNIKAPILCILAFLSIGYLTYHYSSNSKNYALSRKKVLKILNQLHSDWTKIFSQIAKFAFKFIQDSHGDPDDSDIKQTIIILSRINSQLSEAENKIFEKYSTTKTAFNDACKNQYKNDPEIQTLIKNIEKDYDNSLRGIPPGLESSNEFQTTAQFIRNIQEMDTETLLNIYNEIQKAKSENSKENLNEELLNLFQNSGLSLPSSFQSDIFKISQKMT